MDKPLQDNFNGETESSEETAQTSGVSVLPVKQQLLLLAVMLLLIFGSTLTPKVLALIRNRDITTAVLTPTISDITQSVEQGSEKKSFDDIDLTAKSAYVWDIQNQKVLFKKNENTALPLASVAKLMTALIAEEILSDTDVVEIRETAIKQDGDSGLVDGEVFDRLSLTDLTLVSSSNDGAFALAAAVGNILTPNKNGPDSFVHAMNIRAKEIGLNETYFKNPTGLDISTTQGGAYGSARDMAFLMEYIVKHAPGILEFTTDDTARVYSTNGQYHDAENTNEYVDKIPGIIGSKTGYTDLAGGNLVIAFNVGLNRPIAISVLGSTQQERFTDTMKLVAETQKYIANESTQ